MDIRKKNAQRLAEFISYNETLTMLEAALSEPLNEIADTLRDEKIHLNERAAARWNCEQRVLVSDMTDGERLGRLLSETSTTNKMPKSCGLEFKGWGPDNVGWRRAELQTLLDSHELTVTLYPPLPGFEPKSPPIPAEESTPLGGWPWGTHETELLRKLAMAASKFWTNYEPSQPDTAPTNEQVSKWLEKEGVRKRNAQVMATILRANGLKTGPRK